MTASPIPIENIYYLFAYAWNRFDEAKATEAGVAGSPDLPNLLARVLLNGMRSLLRRGLDRNYQPVGEELPTVRGHIDMASSVRLHARRRKRLHCTYDELHQDIHNNRVLKASLRRLARAEALDKNLSSELVFLARRLPNIADINLVRADFAAIRLHRNNGHYGFLLSIAELAFDCLLPNEGGQGYLFRDVLRDERKMARVFEDFVRNFYRVEQNAFAVQPLTIRWDAAPIEAFRGTPLPQMHVDVFLRSGSRSIIIDTKYYATALQTYYDTETVHSGNLYQLFSYLKNAEVQDGSLRYAEGMLLYPCNGITLNEQFQLPGHKITIATVDLSAPWQLIRSQLLALLAYS